MQLRIVNDHQKAGLSCRFENEKWRQVSYVYEVSGWNYNALDGFDSLRVGLYCAGTGAAKFRGFGYRGSDEV